MAKKKSSSKKAFPEFARTAGVMGVAGKRIRANEWGGFDRERLHASMSLAAAVTERLKVPGSPIVVTPSGDLSNTAGGAWMGEVAIGFRVYRASADDGHAWTGLQLDGMRERIVRAAELDASVWRTFVEALCPERADEIVAQLATEPATLGLVASGPLAGGYIGYGILAYERREGFAYLRGQDEEQEPHEAGVVGVLVATADGGSIEEVDLSPQAHAAREEQCAALRGATLVTSVGTEPNPVGYTILATYDSF